MTTIVTRAGKGSPLTNGEVDSNFINLNTDKLEVATAASTYVSLTGSYADPTWVTSLAETKVLPAQTSNSGKFLTTNGTSTSWGTVDFSPYVSLATTQTISGAKTFSGDVRINGVTGGYAGQFYLGDNLRVLRNGAATNDWEMVNADYSAVIFTFANNGNLTASGDITSSSDERLKENIETIPQALAKVESIRGVTFTRKSDKSAGMGVVAQEVCKVAPEVVAVGADGMMSVSYGNLVGLLIEAVKDLSGQVKELQKGK